MCKVYMSVLGTSDYQRCTYEHGEDKIHDVRFVQEATIGLFCKGWVERDRVIVFTTDKAQDLNWLDNGHKNRQTGRQRECAGLKSCIENLRLKCQIDNIHIPEGENEDGIWEIFRIIEKEIPYDAEIIFDITHSFRYLPMLAMVALNYAKTIKNVKISGIYYGAFEVLGEPQAVSKMPLEDRLVPVFDLTAFDQLLDWAVAVDRFVTSGDARSIDQLAQNSVNPVLAETRGQDAAASSVRKLGKTLADFTDIVSTCRGSEIREIGATLKRDFSEYKPSPDAAAFNPLIERVRDELNKFEGDHVKDGLQAVRWCLRHNLIQQGFTILLETIVTAVLLSIDEDIMNKEARNAVTGAARVLQKGGPDKGKDLKDLFYVQSKTYLEKNKELVGPIVKLCDYRNDLNHAGWRKDPKKAKGFRTKLERLINTIEPLLV